MLEAVATAADLPSEALAPPAALLESRFRLVQGVDRETADGLAHAGREAGFRANVTTASGGKQGLPRVAMVGVAMWLATVVAYELLVSQGAPSVQYPPYFHFGPSTLSVAVMSAGMFAIFWVLMVRAAPSARGLQRDIPVAFEADLTPALTAEARARLTTAAPQASAAAPAVPETPEAALLRRVLGQLDALVAAADRPSLPDQARMDLRESAASLRQKAEALATEARHIRGELSDGDTDTAAAAAARIEDRLARLDTLVSASQPADPAERVRLESALTAHRAALQARQDAESGLTRTLAALLEAGAAAEASRRALAHDPDVHRSAERLVGRLQAETRAAATALGEVDESPGRRAARVAAANRK